MFWERSSSESLIDSSTPHPQANDVVILFFIGLEVVWVDKLRDVITAVIMDDMTAAEIFNLQGTPKIFFDQRFDNVKTVLCFVPSLIFFLALRTVISILGFWKTEKEEELGKTKGAEREDHLSFRLLLASSPSRNPIIAE